MSVSGLDALVQSITCDAVIGWRRDVRRVIIFITDEEPHYALDGILVTVLKLLWMMLPFSSTVVVAATVAVVAVVGGGGGDIFMVYISRLTILNVS